MVFNQVGKQLTDVSNDTIYNAIALALEKVGLDEKSVRTAVIGDLVLLKPSIKYTALIRRLYDDLARIYGLSGKAFRLLWGY